MPLNRDQLAKRISAEIQDGDYVNLGIGIPTLVANHIPEDVHILLQTENGLLGMGAYPTEHEVDPDLINAGKETITESLGASYFSSEDSFAMIRGGHIDLTILGAFEVDEQGSIASWMVPGKLVKGMGGAMDLVAGTKRIIVAMTHTDKDGNPKLLSRCNLPLTAQHCITDVFTDYGYFKIKNGAFHLLEHAPDVSIQQIQQATQGKLIVADSVAEMNV